MRRIGHPSPIREVSAQSRPVLKFRKTAPTSDRNDSKLHLAAKAFSEITVTDFVQRIG